MRDRVWKVGFVDIVEGGFAVCGWVHVRNANGEDGKRPFVYSLISEQAYVLDRPAYPRDVRAAAAALRLYCPSTA